MANQVEIHKILSVMPIMVEFTDVSDIDWPPGLADKSNRKPHTEWFYLNHNTGNVTYAATPLLPVPDYLKQAILDYVKIRTPSVSIPNMPEKPSYDAESFMQSNSDEKE